MCLITKKQKVRIAKKDLVFWKVLFKGEDYYYAPYTGMKVLGDVLYEERPGFKFSTRYYGTTKRYILEEGVYHLYKSWFGAKRMVWAINDFSFYSKPVVVKAVVPKGTEYVVGDHDYGRCIAAKKVIYKIKEK